MSLLSTTGSNITVTVVLRAETTNSRGERELVEVGRVTSTGRLQPSTSQDVERLQGMGMAVLETARFITDGTEFPGDHNSQIIAEGKTYTVLGTPERRRASRGTQRDIVRISATSQKPRW